MLKRRSAWLCALTVSVTAGVDCAPAAEPPSCRVAADCASGLCSADGRCEPVLDGAVSVGGAAPLPSGAGGGGQCSSNGDAVLERAEVVLAPGLSATFRIARNVTIDTQGEALDDGRFAWDFSKALPGDEDELIETSTLGGAWYQAEFPGASYAVPLGSDALLGDVVGVFEVREDALLLRGVASVSTGPTETRVTHSPGARVLEFPLAVGGSWTSTSQVTGKALGLPTLYSETYDSQVDKSGTLVTPFGAFEVLRVKTTLTRVVGAIPTVTRSFAFVSACYGAVATVTSKPGELSVEFKSAAEVRRIAP